MEVTALDSDDPVRISEPLMDKTVDMHLPDRGKQSDSHCILNSGDVPGKQPSSTSKSAVMPTWAATNSLLVQDNAVVSKTNSEVVTPLFRQAPTDYATLFTVLSLTQNISAEVVGPNRKTVITLDLALYERAMKIQLSTGNRNWVLRAGELHICFAALHALGKYIEDSGLDTVAIETGIYSPATLRQIFAGKAFKRGVEYHIMNAMACYYLKFERTLSNTSPDSLIEQCQTLRTALHTRNDERGKVFEDLCDQCSIIIGTDTTEKQCGELGSFLNNYLRQVECLLHLIRACRQGDWKEYLAALDEQVKYFFAHDLFNYARLMPVHLAQMNELKITSPETWSSLKEGDFCVKKTGTPFTNLFVDQTLEQCIRGLKVAGGITGITQNESALNRFLLTAPEMTRIVRDFHNRYASGTSTSSSEHYQLSGTIGIRSATNALKIKHCLERHCGGNPFTSDLPLVNVVSMMTVPGTATDDILKTDEKGDTRYKEFVDTRLKTASALSVWDRIEKMKLKTYSTCFKKSSIGSSRVVKLRELLARFLVVQQSRPELVTKLGDTIGTYEMAVTPRSLFATDGTLLLPSDKSTFLKAIETYKRSPETVHNVVATENIQAIQNTTDGLRKSAESHNTETEECLETETSLKIDDQTVDMDIDVETDNCETAASSDRVSVIIIDAQAVVQCIKKTPGMDKISDFGDEFVWRITRMTRGYSEARIIFDTYRSESLKEKTRVKRAGKIQPVKFIIHNSMNIRNVSVT